MATVRILSTAWISLQADTGKYLARCLNCVPNGAHPDSAFVHLDSADEPYAKWTMIRLANGKFALLSDNGKYLARCRNCAPGAEYEDAAFVHEATPNEPYAQWELEM
jgi:hypothetical protein